MSHATLAATNLAIRPASSNRRRRRGHCGCPASVGNDGRTRTHVLGSHGSGDDAVVAGDATAPVTLSRRNAIVAAVAAKTYTHEEVDAKLASMYTQKQVDAAIAATKADILATLRAEMAAGAGAAREA